ncbi:hypothetical protein RJZ90_001925 [Blastomyces dermatitidis]
MLATVVSSTTQVPVGDDDDDDDEVDGGNVVHPEGAVLDVIPAADEQRDNGNGIRDIQQDNACSHHAVKGGGGAEIQQSQYTDDATAGCMRHERHVELGVDLGQVLVEREAAVARKGPAQARLPRMRGDLAAEAGAEDQGFQGDGAGFAVQGLVEELEDGDAGRRADECLEVTQAEEHGHAVEPGGGEADGDGAADGNGDGALRARDLLGKVGGRVKTGEDPIGVDEADDEGDAVGFPACVVDEGGKDEFGVLVRGGLGRDGDDDHREGHEREIESGHGDLGEEFAYAVEEEAPCVNDLVGDDDVPGFDDAVSFLVNYGPV